jgi:hypothetical protein
MHSGLECKPKRFIILWLKTIDIQKKPMYNNDMRVFMQGSLISSLLKGRKESGCVYDTAAFILYGGNL